MERRHHQSTTAVAPFLYYSLPRRPAIPAVEVEPFGAAHIPAAARLLAARHAAGRARLPFLTARLEDPSACELEVAALLRKKRTSGAVALHNGAVVGYLFGEQMLFAPYHNAYQYLHPHSIAIPVLGHAVAGDRDASAVLQALYGFMAESWVRDGYFAHRLYLVPGDPAELEAWVSLGFGRHTTCAVRETALPVRGSPAAGVEIHRAGPEDLAVVMDLAHLLGLHHVQAPMFWPLLKTTGQAAREHHAQELESGRTPYFIAYRNGRPAGMQTFIRPGFTPAIINYETDVYLHEGVVDPQARGEGVGGALLAHAMAWASESGYTTCTLHFASNNPSGAPFWLGHGFVPVEHSMDRIIDQRIAWADGRA